MGIPNFVKDDKHSQPSRQGLSGGSAFFVAGIQTFPGAEGQNRIVVMQGLSSDSRFCAVERAGMDVAPYKLRILEGD